MDDSVDVFGSIFLSDDQRMISAAVPSKQQRAGEGLKLVGVVVDEDFSSLELLEEFQLELS